MIDWPIRIYDAKGYGVKELVKQLRERSALKSNVEEDVKRILEDVKNHGDEALFRYSLKFDGVELSKDDFRVQDEEFNEAYSRVSEEDVKALSIMIERVKKVEEFFLRMLDERSLDFDDVKIRRLLKPIESVGCYVPGGRASYPSSLIMSIVPAKVVGVPRIVVCSPPDRNGRINPRVLVAADLLKVREFYKLGGAHAIAALAFGTESIDQVCKIVGAGGPYVTAAKKLVSSSVAIDMPAGPSEVLIVADDGADSRFVARDLISQAEHGPDSVCGLLTDSAIQASKVVEMLKSMLVDIDRSELVSESLSSNGFIIVFESIVRAVEFANLFAPEHLELMVENSEEILENITSAGLILLGSYSPTSATDYSIGTNHILPTGGSAACYSGLSALDFIKRIQVVSCGKDSLRRLKASIEALARIEGLPNHFLAVEERFRYE